jgi:hypothetical protein
MCSFVRSHRLIMPYSLGLYNGSFFTVQSSSNNIHNHYRATFVFPPEATNLRFAPRRLATIEWFRRMNQSKESMQSVTVTARYNSYCVKVVFAFWNFQIAFVWERSNNTAQPLSRSLASPSELPILVCFVVFATSAWFLRWSSRSQLVCVKVVFAFWNFQIPFVWGRSLNDK